MNTPNGGYTFDGSSARRFLTALLPEGPGNLFIEFRFLHHNGKPPHQEFVQDLSRVPWEKVAQTNGRGWSVTVSPGLRCRKNGKEDDVGALVALWADLDTGSSPEDKREGVRAIFSSLPPELHPSAIVDSGNGVHGWWWLDRPVPVTDESREQMRAILRGLQRTVGSDPVHDLARVMRLPGSMNVKDPTSPRPCRFVSLSADRRFPLEAFAHLAVAGAAPDPAEEVRFAAVPPTVKLRDLRVSGRIKDLIKTGWRNDGEYPTRSEADQAVITALRGGGHSPDEIRALFGNPKWGIGTKYREMIQRDQGADRYLARSIAHADAFLAAERAKEGPGILFVLSTSPPDLKKVQAVILDAFPDLWLSTQAALATPAAMLPDDVLNPSALIFEGASSGGKTTVIDFVDGTPYLGYRTDKFTPRAFVSHAANVPGMLLADVDLLPRIRHRCMLTGELSPLFRGREEDLVENFAILTAVLDGRGLQTDSGSRGRRGYTGDYLFSWIGATTPLPTRTWRLMQQLGARLLFYWMHLPVPEEDEIVANLTGERSYRERLAACRAAVNDFLLALFRAHARKGQERPFGVTWNRRDDPKGVVKQVARLAQVGAEARGVVSVWQDDQGQVNFHPPNVEQPHRLAALLYNLARGHALLHGRTQLTVEDLPLVTRVALDSMPLERRKVLRLLIAAGPKVLRSSEEVKNALGCSKPTALRIMREMGLLEVADVQTDPTDREEGGRPGLTIALPERLAWLAEPGVRDALDLPPHRDGGVDVKAHDATGDAPDPFDLGQPVPEGHWEPGMEG